MTGSFDVVSPGDGTVLLTRGYAEAAQIDDTLEAAAKAQGAWRATALEDRIAVLRAMVEQIVANKDELAREIALQIGRPLGQCPGEIGGFAQRATAMLDLAPEALADVRPTAIDGFDRFVRREPLGVVLSLAPWNYPWLTAVNSIIPAMAAGNTVVLKHSEQTPLVAERMSEAAAAAGLPAGVFSHLHATHDQVATMVADPRVGFVAFTGSVEGGHAVTGAAAARFVGMGLELGGKDPAYVRADADPKHAAENLVDGACFNSGQSCCGVERIYVHESLFGDFVDAAVATLGAYRLGDPMAEGTNLGPMVRAANADRVRAQVRAAVQAGARALVDETAFDRAAPGSPYCAPQLLVDVDHSMDVMAEETFGPVGGVMPVSDDGEAVALMNDSRYGLTASVWTGDADAAMTVAEQLETGTVFMNRCDYLDPELAWVGVKDSGRGCTLSRVGYESLTRPKSFHFRLG
ncbi:MAG: aldehyde dehydrogenase family protein [Proteobacteria bacterium]|nr:aldehyde dehydrogenase family protein [Pseudomonadota bacterium]